jgi:hypothetical protein
MTHLTNAVPTTGPAAAGRTGWPRPAARWLLTFTGFPLGGLLAGLLAGPTDSPAAAALGGLVTGAVLGTVQAWGLGRTRPPAIRWIAATAVGLAVGLTAGAAAVDYRTTLVALMVQGAVCGVAVGAAQAVVLWPRLGRRALGWPVLLAASWAVGWAASTAAGVQVEQQFTVFGSIGAVLVTGMTAVLPVLLQPTGAKEQTS